MNCFLAHDTHRGVAFVVRFEQMKKIIGRSGERM